MRLASFLKPGLLIYEVLKAVIFATVMVLQAQNAQIFTLVVFAVQGTLFPLMALFLCVNTLRYREYLPLYMAGKIVAVFTIMSWSLFTQKASTLGDFISSTTLLCFELSALFAIMTIRNDVEQIIKISELEKTDTGEYDQLRKKMNQNMLWRKSNAYNTNSKRKRRSR